MNARTRILLLALAVGFVSASPASAVGRGDGKTCRSSETNPYVGTYKWRQSSGSQNVRFWFDRIEPASEGKQRAIGRGIYLSEPRNVTISIKALIDLKKGSIEIWESNPNSVAFTTNGSHVGVISADLCAITAVWTSKDSGQRGDLNIRIEPKK